MKLKMKLFVMLGTAQPTSDRPPSSSLQMKCCSWTLSAITMNRPIWIRCKRWHSDASLTTGHWMLLKLHVKQSVKLKVLNTLVSLTYTSRHGLATSNTLVTIQKSRQRFYYLQWQKFKMSTFLSNLEFLLLFSYAVFWEVAPPGLRTGFAWVRSSLFSWMHRNPLLSLKKTAVIFLRF